MGYHFDLDPHVILTKSRHSNACPERLVIGHPFREIARYSRHSFVVDWDIFRPKVSTASDVSMGLLLEAVLTISVDSKDL